MLSLQSLLLSVRAGGIVALSLLVPVSSLPPRRCRFALEQGAGGVRGVEVDQQLVLRGGRVPALLAHVQLVAALLVGVFERDRVDFLHVGFQGAALGEGLVTQSALVRTHACVSADVSLQVERVVEAFPAEAAQMPLRFIVTFKVTIQHALELERLLTNLADKSGRGPFRRRLNWIGRFWWRSLCFHGDW